MSPFEELAARFVAPAKSGVYLARNEIVVLARLEDGSVRLGERKRMLVDVLNSAAGPQELRAVLGRLLAFVRDSLGHYRALSERYDGAAPLFAEWIARAEATERHLVELCEDLEPQVAPD
jgi:hypothetical protein